MNEQSALEKKYIGTEAGSFRIVRLLGMGGMGAVFLATHKDGKLSAAIKLLRDPVGNAEHTGRFLTEARALSQLEHPSLVRLGDYGTLPDGALYLQMEYLRGQPLPDYVQAQGGKLPLRQFLVLARQLAGALSYVHAQRILHRDLKPSNLFVIADSEVEGGKRVKILDFGIAKLLTGGGAQDGTHPSQLIGTPRYMSPEQCEGAAELDDRTDVYSLGLILYELLTGASPYDIAAETQAAWMYAHVQRVPRPLRRLWPEAPAELEALLSQMLDKLAVQRPPMKEIEARLQTLLAGGPPLPAARPRRGLVVLGVGGALLVGVGGLVLGVSKVRTGWLSTGRGGADPVKLAALAAQAPRGMALIPGRSFAMGSSEADIEAAWQRCQKERQTCKRDEYERERPQRVVTVSPFYLDQYEVTYAQYAEFLNAPRRPIYVEQERLVWDGRALLLDLHPKASGLVYKEGKFQVLPGYARRPVVQVTWWGAQAFCAEAGKRLPSEAEWELAARSAGLAKGTAPSVWPWGDEPPRCADVIMARDAAGTCRALQPDASAQAAAPAEVGTATQDVTPQGIHDLAGNVREWVADVFQVPYPACGKCEDPVVSSEPRGVEVRVVRGGNFMQEPSAGRAAGRSLWRADYISIGMGFRCAVSVAQPSQVR